jgi:hypothetical protein
MKKVLVSVMVLVSITTAGFASNPNEDYATLHKLNKNEVFRSLTSYLNADNEQVAFLKNVMQVTDSELNAAEKGNNEKLVDSVVNYNLYNAKCILDFEQYRKYLTFINYYLKNDNLLSLNNN